jgi:uncharacterized oligopeptide transporter (OPT) family protein
MAETDRPTENQPSSGEGLFQRRYPEASLASILFGLAFGAVLTAAITYAGLKIGFTIVGSSIAAVIGFGVLRGLLRGGTILEVNISQTIASAVNSASPGIIFTIPVLYLLYGVDGMDTQRFWLVTLAGVIGGALGTAFIIPLRKQMIDIDRLRFPSGTAVAVILKSPGAGPKKSLVLLLGVAFATAVYLPVELPNIPGANLPGYANLNWRLPDPRTDPTQPLPRTVDRDQDGKPDLILTRSDLDVGRLLGLPDYVLLVFAITPLAFGGGFLTGRAGLMVLAGGLLAAFVLTPAAWMLGWMPVTLHADQAPQFAYEFFNRPLGIGMLLGGAFMGVVAALPAIRAALGSIAGAGRKSADELGLRTLAGIIVVGTIGLFLAADLISPNEATGGLLGGLNHHVRNLIIALVGSAWIWFAGIIVSQCTGMTDWSPVSGMALLTVVLVLVLGGSGEVVTAVLVGAALCLAIACAADMMADLKTGYLVGASPWRQQVIGLASVLIGPVISMTVLGLIVKRNMDLTGLPIGPGTETVAPQAQALQTVIQGVQGGEMPYALFASGALLGVLLGLGAFPGLGVLVGLSMYLPLKYVLTYGLGCLTNMALTKIKGKTWAEEWGVPFAAGLVVGEALIALMVSMLVILLGFVS